MHVPNEKSKRLLAAADAANERMNNFQGEVAASITDLVMKHFSVLNEMDAQHILHFGKIISTHTWRLTQDVDKLRYIVDNNAPISKIP